jgi:ABC-type nickel/cobalt efflux system permease component RcnA
MIRRVGLASPLAIVVLAFASHPASAHPLGNFTVNTYAGIHIVPGEVRVEYVVDMAEIPTFQTLPDVDANADGQVSPAERQAWADAFAPAILANLALEVNGRSVELTVGSASMELRPGQGGLDTLRFEGVFAGPVAGDRGTLRFVDGNYADRQAGWREVTAVGEDGFRVVRSTVPAESASDALLGYPQDLLSSPLRVIEASASFEPGASVGGGSREGGGTVARPGADASPLTGLLANRGIPLVALALLLAAAFGAWHAMLPGHGKTLMAAYMVGAEARARQAVAAGTAVAIMHTASVLALGLAVRALESTFRPERLYPWLGLVSGLVALALGVWLLIARLAAWSAARRHDRGHSHGHAHPHALPEGVPLASRRGLAAIALAGGLVPSPSAVLVMLGAIAAGRAAFGLALVAAFGAGLAGALVLLGVGAIRARDVLARRMSSGFAGLAPIASAAAIVAVGLYLTARGASQVSL